jgi:hypothetical protein
MDDVREDLRRMGVTNWRTRAHRRDDWKMVVKEAKVLQGLQSHGVKSPVRRAFVTSGASKQSDRQ